MRPFTALPPLLAAAWTLLRRALPWLLLLAPAALLAKLMDAHLVNLPFLDDWMFTPLYEHAAAGTLTLDDFTTVQMEHRLVVPRLLLVVWYWLVPGQFTVQNWFTFGLLCVLALQAGVLMRRTFGPGLREWWWPSFLSCLSIFSPIHYQVVLWPMMFQVILPLVGLLTMVLAFTGRSALWWRLVAGVFGALVGMLSFASGLLTWVLGVPLVLFGTGFGPGRRRWIFLACWLGAMAVCGALYFHNLKNQTDGSFSYQAGDGEDRLGSELASLTSDPVKVYRFVSGFVGGHLGRGTTASMMTQSVTAGTLAIVLWAGGAGFWWWRRKDAAMREAWLPWLMLGAYSVGTASMVAVGRAWASSSGDNALTARYTVHGIPMALCLVALAWWWWRRVRGGGSPAHQRARFGFGVVTGAFLLWQAIVWNHGSLLMGTWSSARLRGAANTLFFQLPGTVSHDGVIAGQMTYARRMNELGLLSPAMVRSNNLSRFKIDRKPMARSAGDFSGLWRLDDGRYRAEGYARLPGRDRVADGIFLTVEKNNEPGAQWQIIHVAQCRQMPLFLGDALGRDLRFVHHRGEPLECEDLSGFDTAFNLPAEFTGRTEVAAWAFDWREQRVQILGTFIVDVATGKIEGQRGGGSLARKLERRQKERLRRKAEGDKTPPPTPSPPDSATE